MTSPVDFISCCWWVLVVISFVVFFAIVITLFCCYRRGRLRTLAKRQSTTSESDGGTGTTGDGGRRTPSRPASRAFDDQYGDSKAQSRPQSTAAYGQQQWGFAQRPPSQAYPQAYPQGYPQGYSQGYPQGSSQPYRDSSVYDPRSVPPTAARAPSAYGTHSPVVTSSYDTAI